MIVIFALVIAMGKKEDLKEKPAFNGPRFTDNNNGTVKDNSTGLIWLKDANCFGKMTWQSALNTVSDFNANPTSYNCADYDENNPPYNDWRLPNVIELHSQTDFSRYGPAISSSHPFVNVDGIGYYWSSSTLFTFSYARNIYKWNGDLSARTKTSNFYNWPVRAGQ